MKKNTLRHTLLALSVTAWLVPSYAQSQSVGGNSSSPVGNSSPTTPSSSTSSTSKGDDHSSSTADSSMNAESPPIESGAHSGMSSSSSRAVNAIGTKGSMESDQAMTEADVKLNSRLRAALTSDSSLQDASRNVSIHSDHGVVTLNGAVATEKEKSDLENKIQRMAGVSRVDNNLQMAPRTSNSAARSDSTVTR